MENNALCLHCWLFILRAGEDERAKYFSALSPRFRAEIVLLSCNLSMLLSLARCVSNGGWCDGKVKFVVEIYIHLLGFMHFACMNVESSLALGSLMTY
jgi:hypothetical protein